MEKILGTIVLVYRTYLNERKKFGDHYTRLVHDSERVFIGEKLKEDIWKLCHIEQISFFYGKHSTNIKLYVMYLLIVIFI